MTTRILRLSLDKESGIGTLSFKKRIYDCGGNPSFDYPDDSTIYGKKEPSHHSQEYDVEMKWAVLWDGTTGIYFHEADELTGSAGCIHLLEGDAEKFYDAIIEGERVRIIFKWT